MKCRLLLPLLLAAVRCAAAAPPGEPESSAPEAAPAGAPAEAAPQPVPEPEPPPDSPAPMVELLPELPPGDLEPVEVPPAPKTEKPGKTGKSKKKSGDYKPLKSAPEALPPPGALVISGVEDLRRRVLEANWAIQGRMMDYEVKRRTQEAARGMFDPNFNLSYNFEDSTRPNTVEQRRNLSGVPELDERNHSFQSSIETLTPLGSKLSLTASVSEYKNNLQRLTTLGFGATGDPETVSFIGVAMVQPLLKNAGRKTATAAIRVAACETEQAWQDFRRQLMVSLSSAELAYWNVHGAARQVEYMMQSVNTARQMANDTATLKAAGKAAAADVATAEAGEEVAEFFIGQAGKRRAVFGFDEGGMAAFADGPCPLAHVGS